MADFYPSLFPLNSIVEVICLEFQLCCGLHLHSKLKTNTFFLNLSLSTLVDS